MASRAGRAYVGTAARDETGRLRSIRSRSRLRGVAQAPAAFGPYDRAYQAQVRAYLRWLAGSEHAEEALRSEKVRDWAVRDYKRAMKKRRLKPTTVNQGLAAIDSLYRSLNLGRPDVAREALAQVAPRALEEDAQRRFLRAVERCPSARDRAIATLFLYTGLRLSELAALDVDDVAVSPRRGLNSACARRWTSGCRPGPASSRRWPRRTPRPSRP